MASYSLDSMMKQPATGSRRIWARLKPGSRMGVYPTIDQRKWYPVMKVEALTPELITYRLAFSPSPYWKRGRAVFAEDFQVCECVLEPLSE